MFQIRRVEVTGVHSVGHLDEKLSWRGRLLFGSIVERGAGGTAPLGDLIRARHVVQST